MVITLPLSPSRRGRGFKSLSPGGRGQGEGEHESEILYSKLTPMPRDLLSENSYTHAEVRQCNDGLLARTRADEAIFQGIYCGGTGTVFLQKEPLEIPAEQKKQSIRKKVSLHILIFPSCRLHSTLYMISRIPQDPDHRVSPVLSERSRTGQGHPVQYS